jgi:hypothetical protein
MTGLELGSVIEEAYSDYIKKAYSLAVENALMGETNAVSRFQYALNKATEVRNQILKSL